MGLFARKLKCVKPSADSRVGVTTKKMKSNRRNRGRERCSHKEEDEEKWAINPMRELLWKQTFMMSLMMIGGDFWREIHEEVNSRRYV